MNLYLRILSYVKPYRLSVFVSLLSSFLSVPTLILSIVRMVALFVPLAILLESYLGVWGIYSAIGISNVVMGVWSVLWVRSMLRKEIGRRERDLSFVPVLPGS